MVLVVLRQNSSLVLTSDTRTRDSHEPSGEPETLWGRMKGKMGDRVLYAKPEGMEERKAKGQKKKRQEASREVDDMGPPAKARKTAQAASVLELDQVNFYRPRTQETRAAYEALLSVIRQQFGDQPQVRLGPGSAAQTFKVYLLYFSLYALLLLLV